MSGLILTEQLTSAVALAEGRHTTEPYSFSDIPRLTIPRDIARGWTWQSLLGDVKAGDELEGVYLGHTNPEYALWPYTGGGSNSAPPYLRSVDGVVGYRTGTDAGDLTKKRSSRLRTRMALTAGRRLSIANGKSETVGESRHGQSRPSGFTCCTATARCCR